MVTRVAWLLAVLGVAMGLVGGVQGGRLLLVPYHHGSHVNFFSILGRALSDAGHEVSVLLPPGLDTLAAKQGVRSIVTKTTRVIDEATLAGLQHGPDKPSNPFSLFRTISGKSVTYMRSLFSETDTLAKLKAANFDLVVIDGIDFYRAAYIIPHYLGVKHVTLTARHDPWNAGVPASPGLEGPQIYALHGDTNILQRVASLVLGIAQHFLPPPSPFSQITNDLISELVPGKPNPGFPHLFKNSEMFLLNTDTICLDFHRISAPHYQFIGALGAQKAKPLPKDIEQFVAGSKDGFILVTFGSSFKIIEAETLDKMIAVFSMLPQNVIIRHEGPVPDSVPANIRFESWLPQNDILGAANTRLFVTHGGQNGQLEAVYHGVPMLTMPFFGDQHYNARRAEIHGYARTLDPEIFTTEQLREAVQDLLYNATYRDSVQKCSAIVKAMPDPKQTAVFWIEHVLRFGGAHLKPYYAADAPVYQYFMLDIMVLFGVVVYVVYAVICMMCRRCCVRNDKNTRKKKSD